MKTDECQLSYASSQFKNDNAAVMCLRNKFPEAPQIPDNPPAHEKNYLNSTWVTLSRVSMS